MGDLYDDIMGLGPAEDDDDDLLPEVQTSAMAAGQLRALVERIERLEDEKKAVAEDIKEVYAEAKAHGFDNKTLRKIIAIRKKNREEFQEEEALLELYMSALGMI